MSVDIAVEKLREEINQKKRKDVIDTLEERLIENIDQLLTNDDFFHLPLVNIFSVLSKIDFMDIDNAFIILQNFIQKTVKSHFEEKETILIFQSIDTTNISLLYEKILSILEIFTNCPILRQLSRLHQQEKQQPVIDYDYEFHEKDKEIEKLKLQINELEQAMDSVIYEPIYEKPTIYFEPDIFIACEEGHLLSVKWLIKKKKGVKNKTDSIKRTPLHYACLAGQLQIVKYLLYKNANINAKDINGDYAIHYATKQGHLQIIKYLIYKQNSLNDVKGFYGKTPLHYACEYNHLPIVRYLIEKQKVDKHFMEIGEYNHLPIFSHGVNIEAEDYWERTPLHIASFNNNTDIVKYLVSIGANKNAIDKEGKTPYDLARNDEIKRILQFTA